MRSILLTLYFWLCLLTNALAQPGWPPVYTIKTDAPFFRLDTAHFQILEDSQGTLTFAQVQRSTEFRYGKQYDKNRRAHVYWLRMRLKNELPDTLNVHILSSRDYADTYWRSAGSSWLHGRVGNLVPKSQLPAHNGKRDSNRLFMRVEPAQEIMLYQRLENVSWHPPIQYLSLELETEDGLKDREFKYYWVDENWRTWAGIGIAIGILLLAFAYNLIVFLLTRENVYLYFGICLLFFVLDRNKNLTSGALFADQPYLFFLIAEFFFMAFFVFFVQAIRRFVQPTSVTNKIDRFISIGLAITVLLNLLQILSYSYPVVSLQTMEILIEVAIRVVYGLCVLLIYRMMKQGITDTGFALIATLPLFLWWFYTLIDEVIEAYFSINLDEHLPAIFQYAETICFAWMIIAFSGALINRYNLTRRQVVQQAIEKEQLEKEREMERNRIIANQNERLEQQVKERTAELRQSLETLRATQEQLIQKEKLASLGELTAGIAHEIQNPLNFINNFAEVSEELLEELNEERHKSQRDETLEEEILGDLQQNLGKIRHHGHRADAIVKGMLEHSRASTGEKQITDLNALADEYLRLAYHGLRAKDKTFNCQLITNLDPTLPKVIVVAQDIGRVLLNLYNNAFYAVQEKARRNGESQSPPYQPTVIVKTYSHDSKIVICVRDNGTGIPESVKRKIFQPFFTTKPTGQGTGLGLSLAYDIITKGHGGELTIEGQEGEGTEFTIRLPF